MADIKYWIPIVRKWEGGYVNDPNDRGGETNMGITIETWKGSKYYSSEVLPNVVGTRYGKPYTWHNVNKSLYNMSDSQWMDVAQNKYWNKWKADSIKNQSIANLVVDWYWGSGKYGIIFPQRILGVKDDGIVGSKTISAINDYPNQRELFDKLWNRRKQHFIDLSNKAGQAKFLKGWLNRLNDFKYEV